MAWMAFLRRFVMYARAGLILGFLLLPEALASYLYLTTPHSVASPQVINLIETKIHQRKYKEAKAIVEHELKMHPNDIKLYFEKADIAINLEQLSEANQAIDTIEQIQPHNKKIAKLRQVVREVYARQVFNELGFGQNEVYVSDIGGYWSYSSLHYFRFTDYGTYGLRINYANRYGIGGEQYVIETYPRLNDRIFATLIFGWSNTSQRVFPEYMATFEPYLKIRQDMELSLGMRYIRSFRKNIYDYTGSLGVYPGDFYFWFRPHHYTPKSANYFEVGLRRYFDPNTYMGIRVGTGRYPDIGDVPPLNQILIVRANAVNLEGQLPLSRNVYFKAGAGYARQNYPSGLTRHLTDLSGELNVRF